MTATKDYTGGYTVVDQRTGSPDCKVLGHYQTLAAAAKVATTTTGAAILRTVGLRYDLTGFETVSRLVQRCGVTTDGTTYVWPA